MIKLPSWNPVAAKAAALKWGVILLVQTVLLCTAYFYGKVVARAEYEADKVEVIEKDRDRAVEDGRANAETAERVGGETARLEAALERAIRRAEDAIKANENRRSTTCELTDDELASLQAIRDSYKQ